MTESDATPPAITVRESCSKSTEQGSVEGQAASDGGRSKMYVPLDGYSWRKYGQKFIKNIGKYRSYFKCQNASCNVKKRVEWSSSEPHNVRVVYDLVHSHGSSIQEATASQESASTNQYNLFTQVFGADQESSSIPMAKSEK